METLQLRCPKTHRRMFIGCISSDPLTWKYCVPSLWLSLLFWLFLSLVRRNSGNFLLGEGGVVVWISEAMYHIEHFVTVTIFKTHRYVFCLLNAQTQGLTPLPCTKCTSHRFVLYYTISLFLVDSTILWGAFLDFKVRCSWLIWYHQFVVPDTYLLIIPVRPTLDSGPSGAQSLPRPGSFPTVC